MILDQGNWFALYTESFYQSITQGDSVLLCLTNLWYLGGNS